MKPTVIGLDGKPVAEADVHTLDLSEYGMDASESLTTPGRGRVVIVAVGDKQGNSGQAVVYVPNGTETKVEIQVMKPVSFMDGVKKAQDAKERGDLKEYQEGREEVGQAIERLEETNRQTQEAIDAWARGNNMPILTLKKVETQLEIAEKAGSKVDLEAAEKLRIYKAQLEWLEESKANLKAMKDYRAKMLPPEKKVVGLPSTCPEGQSGGFLAGVLNSVTGTNSLTGICGEEIEKDNKDRKARDREDDRDR